MSTQDRIERVAQLVRPLNQEIVIVPETPEEVTANGIYLPEVSRGTMCTGHVAGVGPDAGDAVGRGDRVYFDAFSTKDIKICGIEVSLVTLENVKCVLNTTDKVEAVSL